LGRVVCARAGVCGGEVARLRDRLPLHVYTYI
jgi:hypothetical protein